MHADDLLNREFPPLRWLVPDLLPQEGLAVLAGRPKQGKSFLALQLAIAVANGGEFLGRRISPGNVAYFALEDSERRMQARLRDLGYKPGTGLLTIDTRLPAGIEAVLALLKQRIRDQKLDLVVIDTISRVLPGGTDQNDVGRMTEYFGKMQQLGLDTGALVKLIDHQRKSPAGSDGSEPSGVDSLLGSTGKAAVVDTIWSLSKKDGQSKLEITGRDLGSEEVPLKRVGQRWEVRSDSRVVAAEDNEEAIIHQLHTGGPQDAAEVGKALGTTREAKRGPLNRLVEQGLVAEARSGQRRVFHVWTSAVDSDE